MMQPIKHTGDKFDLDYHIAMEDIEYENEKVFQTLHLIGKSCLNPAYEETLLQDLGT